MGRYRKDENCSNHSSDQALSATAPSKEFSAEVFEKARFRCINFANRIRKTILLDIPSMTGNAVISFWTSRLSLCSPLSTQR